MKLECECKLEHVEETCAVNLGDPLKQRQEEFIGCVEAPTPTPSPAATPLPHPFPRGPLSRVQSNASVKISIFNHPSQSVWTVCSNRIFFLSSFFFFNWKEALNTLKVASGTSSQHALHLLLLRQASLQPLCKLCFQLQKLVWTWSVTEAVQTGFCNWKGGKTKDF